MGRDRHAGDVDECSCRVMALAVGGAFLGGNECMQREGRAEKRAWIRLFQRIVGGVRRAEGETAKKTNRDKAELLK